MSMNHKEINEQERQLILSVIWTLERLVLQVLHLRACDGMTPERVQGQQDALELIEESVACAKSITDADILRTIERAEEGLPAAVLACGTSRGRSS